MSAICSFLENLPASCQLGLEGRLDRLHAKEKTLTSQTDVKATSSWTKHTLLGDLDRATTLYTMGFGRVYDMKAIPKLVGAAFCSIATIPARLVRTVWSVCCLVKAILPSHRTGVFDPLLENVSALLQATVMTIASVALAAFKLMTFVFRDTYTYFQGKGDAANPRKVLLIIDVQKDFEPGGALTVPEGDKVIPSINAFLQRIKDDPTWYVALSQDWHPFDHESFAVQNGCAPFDKGTLNGIKQQFWPAHCVQGSNGAKIDERLNLGLIASSRLIIVKKGFKTPIDSYSSFQDNRNPKDKTRREDTVLDENLEHWGIKEAAVVGVASDYCVKYSAKDAVARGYATTVIKEGCRGLGKADEAFAKMQKKNIHVVDTVEDYFKAPRPKKLSS